MSGFVLMSRRHTADYSVGFRRLKAILKEHHPGSQLGDIEIVSDCKRAVYCAVKQEFGKPEFDTHVKNFCCCFH